MNREVVEKKEDINNNGVNVDYIFEFRNGGWWLKINTFEKLMDYIEKTDSRWVESYDNLSNSKEFGVDGSEHAGRLATAIGLYGSNRSLNGIDATIRLRNIVVENMLNELNKGNILFINSSGGYFGLSSDNDNEYKQWCREKELIYPDFNEKDIRIKKFPLGTHWYAYIGNMQLRDNDMVKWDSYEEAYNYAKKFINIE